MRRLANAVLLLALVFATARLLKEISPVQPGGGSRQALSQLEEAKGEDTYKSDTFETLRLRSGPQTGEIASPPPDGGQREGKEGKEGKDVKEAKETKDSKDGKPGHSAPSPGPADGAKPETGAAKKELAAQDDAQRPLPAPSGQPAAGDDENLAAAIQNELSRTGCSRASADNRWGKRSRKALEKFNRIAGISVPAREPSPEALAALKTYPQDYCKHGSAGVKTQPSHQPTAKHAQPDQAESSYLPPWMRPKPGQEPVKAVQEARKPESEEADTQKKIQNVKKKWHYRGGVLSRREDSPSRKSRYKEGKRSAERMSRKRQPAYNQPSSESRRGHWSSRSMDIAWPRQ